MAPSEAKKKANAKYIEEKTETIYIRVPKGDKDAIKDFAAQNNESVNQFVIRLIKEAMENGKNSK